MRYSPKGKPSSTKTSTTDLAAAVRPAEKLARKAHAGQTDLAGKPRISHVQRVAKASADYGHAAKAAAWLHDTVEDTDIKADHIAEKFPPEVAAIVRHLTRGREETYNEYITRLLATENSKAVLVKLADLRDHARVTPESLNIGLARRYDMAYRRLARSGQSVTKHLQPDEMESPFTRLVEKYEAERIAAIEGRRPAAPQGRRRRPAQAGR